MTDADRAAAIVVQWNEGAAESLANDKLTPTERARLGDLVLSAATWLADREAKLAKSERDARARALHDAVKGLPLGEQIKRISQGY